MTICAACGAENREGARFCDSCAAPLAEPAAQSEHRKTVTVVFADVTGSTALGEQLDSESFRRVLARYFEEAKSIVERHGGTVEKFIGDAVMAVFGVPVVHEDDAVRAVRAAHQLAAVIDALGPELERDYGVRLELRMGVNTGEVVTGTEERLATGDAVNVAARFQQAAAPGEILIGAETLTLARDAVTVETLEPIELKGKHEPVPVYRLVAVDSAAPGLARHLDAPMVGRTHEQKLLEDAFANAVRQRACALFTLLGTAGVGKSRLTREFLAGVDAKVVEGRCLSYGEGITYWPVIEIVKQLGGTAAAPPEVAATIATLLGEDGAATSPEEIAWGVRKLLESTAEQAPLVVLLDDIHWGEPTFFDLVEHIADLSRSAPILLLCLARPELLERRPGWGGGKLNATTVLLEPLDAGETDELIERLLGEGSLDPELEARIRTASAGNPLYVEEMVAMVRESGERDVVVPPTIRALLAARLDQLDPAERVVLERGSVEGQLFHSAAVQALATPPAPVERQLVGLVRKEMVRPDRPQLPVGDAYRFRHLLIRDAAYDALPKAVRAELHERFAAWLEARGPELVEHDEILGYHLEQAYRYRAELGPLDAHAEALGVRAAELLTASGNAARTRGDLPAAARLLSRAADLDVAGRLALLPEIAEILFETGEFTTASALLAEALETARRDGDEGVEAVASVWQGMLAGHVGHASASMEDVVALAERSAAILERLGDRARLATVLDIGARHDFYRGRAQKAVDEFARARDIALELGDMHRARESVQWSFGAMGYGPTPAREAFAYLDALPEPLLAMLEREMAIDLLRAQMSANSGRFDEARVYFSRGWNRAGELGRHVHHAGLVMFLGQIELLAGDLAASERAFRDGYERLAELGETGFRSTISTMLADVLVRLDRLEEAEEVLALAEEIAARDDVDPQVRLRAVRGQILARRGDLVEAERLARDAVEFVARTDYLPLHGDTLNAFADVLLAAGKSEEAAAALREAADVFDRKEATVQAAKTRDRLRALAV